ncbi:MAG: hypothetical protein A4E55_02368 [Pelotomaculum sp. PtaU1.Bin035]|nr:MAG: hypothetical protein A4E55_02368 [Pelotomaculum sp. PtaU1.Bin035]
MAVMEDRGTSVLAKLKNKAKGSGKPLQVHMQLFCQEEFLRRLSMSEYADNLILKGGLFIYTLTNFESRATVDIDFLLRQLPGTVEEIESIIQTILAVDTGNDFITFEAKGFAPIALERKYKGVEFQIIGHIKNTRTPFNVDIGIGDVIVPKAEKRTIPVQLDGFECPLVSTYSLESTIAEKFDAMLQRLELNSRMKDFYDIYFLAHMFDFDGRKLQEAIFETLQNRGTAYNRDSLKAVIALVDDSDMQTRWRQAIRRMQLPGLVFTEVMSTLQAFLAPVFDAVVNEKELLKAWSAENQMWLGY